jgi:hypothetical protein
MRPSRPVTRPGIEVSIGISIYNAPGNERAELLSWSLKYWQGQTLPPAKWELVLIDDMSDKDITPAYKPYISKLNITHLKMDHRKHPIWKEINPKGFTSIEEENWPHTPGLSTNLFFKHSKGKVLCFSQPEILPSPNALATGFREAWSKKLFVFSELVLTPPKFREKFLQEGKAVPFPQIWQQALGSLAGENPTHYKVFPVNENYWMFAFLDKRWAMQIGGVDEEYQRGVYAEDDNFRRRTEMIGVRTHRDRNIFAVHLNTEHETHKKQQRDQEPWLTWAKRNRARYHQFLQQPRPRAYLANEGKDWGSSTCVQEVVRHTIGG